MMDMPVAAAAPRQRRTRMTSSLNISDRFYFATALNKGGIALLEEGKVTRSLELFQEALVLCGQAVRQLDAEEPLETEVDHERVCSQGMQQEQSMLLDTTDDQGANHHEEKRSDCRTSLDCSSSLTFVPTNLQYIERVASKYVTNGFVDWRALNLNNPQSLPPTMCSFFLLSFVATYNVALCHQFKGMCFGPGTSPASRSQALHKATKSYEIVHHMMAQEPELQSDIWMLIVLMNNLSRVLICIGDNERATLCSQRLLAILMYVSDHEDLNMKAQMFERYFSNVSSLILRKSKTAAAA